MIKTFPFYIKKYLNFIIEENIIKKKQ